MTALGQGAAGDPTLHPVLVRQLRRLHIAHDAAPAETAWQALLARVSSAYHDADQRHYLSERALEVSSGEMRELHDRLRRSQMRQAAVFDTASVGLLVIDRDGRIEDLNPAARRELGREEHELVGTRLWESLSVVAESDAARRLDAETFAACRQALDGWQEDDAVVTCGMRSFLAACVLTLLVESDGQFAGAVVVLRDITQHKRAQAELAWRATHDALTGLPNRTRIMSLLRSSIADRQRADDRPLTVLFLDLDRFKAVNDTLGHAAGDDLLRHVVRRVTAVARSTDVVGRLAGDEFVLISETDAAGAVRLGERIIAALERPVDLDGKSVFVSASVGVAVMSAGSNASTILAEADRAMYDAKQAGRGRVCVYQPSDTGDPGARLEGDLREAVKAHELDVAYQAELDLATGKVTGFELLSRWSRGSMPVPPSVFIPIAENSGIIHDLGEGVLGAAASALARWGRAAGTNLSVNVSASQLRNPELINQVSGILARFGVAPELLTIEISESVVTSESEETLRRIGELKALGVRLAIDDFGSAATSITLLRALPFDDVKLDAGFVGALVGDDAGRAVLGATIDICHALGRRVVAECVETAELADALRALGCDAALGWHFSRPGDEQAAQEQAGADPADRDVAADLATVDAGVEVAASDRHR